MICPNCFSTTWVTNSCAFCHYSDGDSRDDFYLPVGHLLSRDQYLIGKVLGSPGGFGITYLAWDTRLENKVAIKEYLPRHLASRASGALVRAHTKGDSVDFQFGMDQFLTEAKILARMKHPNIIRVLTYFEENGTAYLVMDYLEGENLSEYLTRIGKLNAPDGIQLMLPIIDGLSHIHAQGFIHRDVKPSNIYLTTDGHTILLDFGAARQALQEKSQSMTSILTPGYAPWEQYHRKGNQGPWTDVYACAAVLYQMITGQLPTDSQERLAEDSLLPPNELNASIPTAVSKAILHGLSLKPTDRPQTAQALGHELQASIFQWEEKPARTPSISPKSPSMPIPNQKASASIDISSSKQSAAPETEFSWEAEEKRSSPFRFIALFAVIAVLAVAAFGGYQYYQRSGEIKNATAKQSAVIPQQNTTPLPPPTDINPKPTETAPTPATPVKPLSIQDGKIAPFPYLLRDNVTRSQILSSGLGPLVSSDSKFINLGGAGIWSWEYHFKGITIRTTASAGAVNEGTPAPQGNYKETICSISLVGSTYETARGIRIGMSEQELINRYGPWPNKYPNIGPNGQPGRGGMYFLVKAWDDITLSFSRDASKIITGITIAYPLN